MSSEPTDEAISNFVSFTSTSREQAISFLKANDLDSNKAINAYFEDPTGPQTQETEALTNTNRIGLSAYQIQHSDPVPTSPTLLPLSRPPSALNLKDSTQATEPQPPKNQAQPATTGNGLSLAEQEERQLQQAVAMSLNQNLGQQETGVTSANQKKFGRATRDHYDEGDWAMTLFNSSAREIIVSPDPADRKRIDNEPAFVRPSQDILYLSGLLTILHSIPLAREALLLRSQALSNYGHDSQWWNGQPINLPKIVTIHEAQDNDTDWDDIIHETQRVIAFLDSTERAFGSADTLAGLKCLSAYNSEGNVSRFLESWQESAVRADPGNPLATAFSSTAYKRPMYDYDAAIENEFFVLEPFIDRVHGQTLYDVLDHAMWSDTPGEELDDVWLEHAADILTIRLDSPDTTKPVDVKIPAVFYPDRYLASCRDIARDYRTQKLQVYRDILNLQGLIDRFSTPKKFSSKITSREILEKAAAVASTIRPKDPSNSAPESTAHSEDSAANVQKLATKLRDLSKKIEAKLKELEERKQSAMENLRTFSRFLAEPSDSPSEPPVHKYTLRGVCTEPHITYVLRSNVPHVSGNTTVGEPIEADGYQWWRVSFSTEDAKSRQTEFGQKSRSTPKNTDVIGYTARKVREIEVLRAAREESKSVLLVYANSNAMSIEEEPAPTSLQDFVKSDNKAFEAELQDSMENPKNSLENQSLNHEGGVWEHIAGTRPAFPSPALNEDGGEQNPSMAAPQKVNVFDYQVSSFEDESTGQEMQERTGRPLLSRSTTGPKQPSQETNPTWSQ